MRTALYESSSNEARDWAILREPRLYQSFQQQKGLINNIYQWVRNRAIKEKLALVHKFSGKRDTIKLLDIGCGTGEFLASAKASGMQTKGIEPSTAAREQAIHNHQLNVEGGGLEKLTESYDVISFGMYWNMYTIFGSEFKKSPNFK